MTTRTSPRLWPVTLAAGALLVLTSCSHPQAGNPEPHNDQPGSASFAPVGSTSSLPSANTKSTKQLNPCDVLSPAEQQSLTLTSGAQKNLAGGRGCKWTVAGLHSAMLNFWDDKGIDQLNNEGTQRTNLRIGNHSGAQFIGGVSAYTCMVDVSISDTSTAGVIVHAGYQSADQACQIGQQVAKAVEPKLP